MIARVRESLRRLGPAGMAGIVLLLCGMVFHLSTLAPAQRELSARRIAAEPPRGGSPFRAVSGAERAQDLQRFYGNFPAMQKLPDELERLYGMARTAGIELLQGEYRLERRGSGLASYRITLPMRGTYPEIREFVGATLKQMPYAAVDTLRFERRRVGETQIEAQMRLIVYFRSSEASDP